MEAVDLESCCDFLYIYDGKAILLPIYDFKTNVREFVVFVAINSFSIYIPISGESADYTLLSTVTGNYYNSSTLPVYRSTGNAVRLHFVSDDRTEQTGFKVGFISIASGSGIMKYYVNEHNYLKVHRQLFLSSLWFPS